jgi:3-oxoacyl-[acyl-carrier protein] reductase
MNKRSVLITGVTSGIGNAIFNKILEKSKSLQVEQLIYLGRNEEKIDKLKYKQRENNLEMIPVVYDLEDIDNLSKKIFDIAKTIKNDLILINNAGYTEPASLLETTNSNLKKTFNVNFFAPIIITRDLLKAKIKLDKIVNIASTAGMTARPGWLSYGASKAALINASLTLYDELIQDEIYVFCISP